MKLNYKRIVSCFVRAFGMAYVTYGAFKSFNLPDYFINYSIIGSTYLSTKRSLNIFQLEDNLADLESKLSKN